MRAVNTKLNTKNTKAVFVKPDHDTEWLHLELQDGAEAYCRFIPGKEPELQRHQPHGSFPREEGSVFDSGDWLKRKSATCKWIPVTSSKFQQQDGLEQFLQAMKDPHINKEPSCSQRDIAVSLLCAMDNKSEAGETLTWWQQIFSKDFLCKAGAAVVWKGGQWLVTTYLLPPQLQSVLRKSRSAKAVKGLAMQGLNHSGYRGDTFRALCIHVAPEYPENLPLIEEVVIAANVTAVGVQMTSISLPKENYLHAAIYFVIGKDSLKLEFGQDALTALVLKTASLQRLRNQRYSRMENLQNPLPLRRVFYLWTRLTIQKNDYDSELFNCNHCAEMFARCFLDDSSEVVQLLTDRKAESLKEHGHRRKIRTFMMTGVAGLFGSQTQQPHRGITEEPTEGNVLEFIMSNLNTSAGWKFAMTGNNGCVTSFLARLGESCYVEFSVSPEVFSEEKEANLVNATVKNHLSEALSKEFIYTATKPMEELMSCSPRQMLESEHSKEIGQFQLGFQPWRSESHTSAQAQCSETELKAWEKACADWWASKVIIDGFFEAVGGHESMKPKMPAWPEHPGIKGSARRNRSRRSRTP